MNRVRLSFPGVLHRCLLSCVLLAGACVPAQGQWNTPASNQLFAAIDAEDLAGVSNALAAGASLDAVNKVGFTPLTAAAAQGNARLFAMLLDAGADINAPDRDHWTALIRATQLNQIDVARLLLQRGADVNATDQTGRSAIFYTGSHTEMVALLLSAHPDLSITDRDGKSVLGEESFSRHGDVFEMLAAAGAQYTSATDALYGAASTGNLKNIDKLLADGANPNGITGVTINMTPLMVAAFKGNTAAVRDLLAHGGDPTVADRNAQDTLYWACASKNLGTAEAVLEALPSLNGSGSNFRRSALITVVSVFDDPGVVRRLLDAGVDINATDRLGESALMHAARAGHRRDVAALLDAGADAALRDRSGKTAADYARAAHDEGMAKALDRAAAEQPQEKH